MEKCGGVRAQSGAHAETPREATANQLAVQAKAYKLEALKNGIAFREAGLFPPDDPFLTELSETEGLHPFEKHLAGTESPYQQVEGGWSTGNSAAEHGFDLRLFYQEKDEDPYCDDAPDEYATLVGAARLGDPAAIGSGFWTGAHGGAIATLLDESTAELAKIEFAPLCSTAEATFKFKKPVPLHTTLRVDCKITKVQGIKCFVTGTLRTPESKTILASVDAVMANAQPILAAAFQK